MYMLELYRDSLIDLFANDRHPANLEIRKDKKHVRYFTIKICHQSYLPLKLKSYVY